MKKSPTGFFRFELKTQILAKISQLRCTIIFIVFDIIVILDSSYVRHDDRFKTQTNQTPQSTKYTRNMLNNLTYHPSTSYENFNRVFLIKS